ASAICPSSAAPQLGRATVRLLQRRHAERAGDLGDHLRGEAVEAKSRHPFLVCLQAPDLVDTLDAVLRAVAHGDALAGVVDYVPARIGAEERRSRVGMLHGHPGLAPALQRSEEHT